MCDRHLSLSSVFVYPSCRGLGVSIKKKKEKDRNIELPICNCFSAMKVSKDWLIDVGSSKL